MRFYFLFTYWYLGNFLLNSIRRDILWWINIKPHLTWGGGGIESNSIDFDLQRFSYVNNPYETTINENIVSSGSLLSPTIYYPKSYTTTYTTPSLGQEDLSAVIKFYKNGTTEEIDYVEAGVPFTIRITIPKAKIETNYVNIGASIQEKDSYRILNHGYINGFNDSKNFTSREYNDIVLPNNPSYKELAVVPTWLLSGYIVNQINLVEFHAATPTVMGNEILHVAYDQDISTVKDIASQYKIIVKRLNRSPGISSFFKATSVDTVTSSLYYTSYKDPENEGEFYKFQFSIQNHLDLYFIDPESWMNESDFASINKDYPYITAYPMNELNGGKTYSISTSVSRKDNNEITIDNGNVYKYNVIGVTFKYMEYDDIIRFLCNSYANGESTLGINLII